GVRELRRYRHVERQQPQVGGVLPARRVGPPVEDGRAERQAVRERGRGLAVARHQPIAFAQRLSRAYLRRLLTAEGCVDAQATLPLERDGTLVEVAGAPQGPIAGEELGVRERERGA